MMKIELREELNDTLCKVWLAGWKITDVAELNMFAKSLSLALLGGWDAEHDGNTHG